MEKIEIQIRDEMARFRQALPQLLSEHRGEWLIFLGGEVKASFADEDAAYNAAIDRYGEAGGFVIVQAVEEVPRIISHSRWAFGL